LLRPRHLRRGGRVPLQPQGDHLRRGGAAFRARRAGPCGWVRRYLDRSAAGTRGAVRHAGRRHRPRPVRLPRPLPHRSRPPAALAVTSERNGAPLGAAAFVVGASIVTLLINQFWTGLFALPGTPHYFALFAWGSTFGGFALVVVYLLMSVGSLRSFATSSRR